MEPAWNDLPIAPLLPAIAAALNEGGALALQAQTGAGKTTAVPTYLVSNPGNTRFAGKIIILEPRRLAAIAAAHRVSALLGDRPGGLAGYRIRGAVKAGPKTRVEFVTQAVFLRMIQDDPFVQDIGLVIFDEFHERTLTADLALAFTLEARQARGDLFVLVMSATMETAKVAAYLGCPELSSAGRAWPVELRYLPPLPGEYIESTVARGIETALEASPGDILTFLPGLRELRRTASILADRGIGQSSGKPRWTNVEVVLLHGSLALEEQKKVISPEPGCGRRVVLATNVAETSLTVPGVTAVVDAGLSRFLGWHPRSGLNRLETGLVSLAEAEQRRGRAGRLGPGLCIRCWDKELGLPVSRGPEIGRSGLTGLVLECAARGIRSPADLRWLDPPPDRAWEAGATILADLGLIEKPAKTQADGPNKDWIGSLKTEGSQSIGAITPAGRKVLSLGIDPRPGAALIAITGSAQPGNPLLDGKAEVHTTILACAVLGERESDDFFGDGDFCSRLRRVLEGPSNERTKVILEEAQRLAGRLGLGRFDPDLAKPMVIEVGRLLAPGFPDRLARLLPDGSLEFRSGRRARAVAELPRSDWILALDVDAGDPLGTIRQGAALSAEAVLNALAQSSGWATELEWRGLKVIAFERLRSGCFVLSERRLASPDRAELVKAVRNRLVREGLNWLPWGDASTGFLARLRYATRLGIVSEVNPSLISGDAGTAARSAVTQELEDQLWDDVTVARYLDTTLVPYLMLNGPVLEEAALVHALTAMIEPDAVRILNSVAPAIVRTPGGRSRSPEYPSTGPARLAMRIQEAFGLNQVPRICGRPLVIELLSPADRPLQVTDDLASFWKNTYPSLRTELKRRYPKHYWPEDPLTAEPTKGLRPRTTLPRT